MRLSRAIGHTSLCVLFGLPIACLLEANPNWQRPGETGTGSAGPTTSEGMDASSDTQAEGMDAASTSDGDGDGDGTTGDGDGDGDGDGQLIYEPSIFTCVDTTVLSTVDCQAYAGGTSISVDLVAAGGQEHFGFVAVPLDGALTGRTVTRVRLSMRTLGANGDGGSDSTGELWNSEAFTIASLESGLPAVLGATPLAADTGPVASGTNFDLDLPTDSVAPDTTLYLRYEPLSENGLWVRGLGTNNAPELIVDYVEP